MNDVAVEDRSCEKKSGLRAERKGQIVELSGDEALAGNDS